MTKSKLLEATTDKFTCPPLKYESDALKPALSKRNVDYHYDKRTKGYYKKVNELVKGTTFEAKDTLEALLTRDSMLKTETLLFNQCAQAWNHTFFWDNLAPRSTCGKMSDELSEHITKDFTSIVKFKDEFIEAGKSFFGSGWLWLVLKHNKLILKTTVNAANPLATSDETPLMVIDLWEHSSEIDYPADKEAYLNAIYQIIDWTVVNTRFTKVMDEKNDN